MPVDGVRDEVVVLDPVLEITGLVIDLDQPLLYTLAVLSLLQSPELPGEHLVQLLTHPPALGVGCEGKVVRPYPPQTTLMERDRIQNKLSKTTTLK